MASKSTPLIFKSAVAVTPAGVTVAHGLVKTPDEVTFGVYNPNLLGTCYETSAADATNLHLACSTAGTVTVSAKYWHSSIR